MSEETDETFEVMKLRLCTHFHRKFSKTMSNSGKRRKLILHFDVNKTIVPVDSATGETVEDALNVYLSGMAWGKVNEGNWERSREELSISPPAERDHVSFYKYEEKRMFRDSQVTKDRSAFRNHLTSFTDKPQGSNFKPFLNTLLQNLKWNLPYDEKVHAHMTVPGTKECRYHFILPAFFKLLNHLVDEKRDFVVVFRTFGSDANGVLSCIKAVTEGHMPFCHPLDSLAKKMNPNVFVMKRLENCLYQLTPGDDKFAVNNVERCTSPDAPDVVSVPKTDKDMYTKLTNASGIFAIQDDVDYWYKHGFHPSKGKPIWIDYTDAETQHILFDDNIRPGMSDSIVNIRLRNSTGSFRNVDRAEEYKFVNTNIVPVTFSDAIMDENYFVNKVLRCEENFKQLLQNE